MDSEVPDYFEDPIHEISRQAAKSVKEQLTKWEKEIGKAEFWALVFQQQIDVDNDNSEIPDLPLDKLIHIRLLYMENVMFQMLEELKKLNNPVK